MPGLLIPTRKRIIDQSRRRYCPVHGWVELDASGNAVQVGTDNAIRISSAGGMVVGGAADSCCCSADTPPIVCTFCKPGTTPKTITAIMDSVVGCTSCFVSNSLGISGKSLITSVDGTYTLQQVDACTWQTDILDASVPVCFRSFDGCVTPANTFYGLRLKAFLSFSGSPVWQISALCINPPPSASSNAVWFSGNSFLGASPTNCAAINATAVNGRSVCNFPTNSIFNLIQFGVGGAVTLAN